MDAGTVSVQAYDVHVWSEPKGTTVWIVDPTTNHHDSQVLRLPPSDQPFQPQSLLADPVLNETLSAGLAGPPPQLDWLFADHPMERLFDENHEITFGQPRVLAGLTCETVLVNADGDHYRFWIDPTQFADSPSRLASGAVAG